MVLSNNGNVAMCKLFYPACVSITLKESTVTIKCSPDLDFRAGLFIKWLGIFHINKQQ